MEEKTPTWVILFRPTLGILLRFQRNARLPTWEHYQPSSVRRMSVTREESLSSRAGSFFTPVRAVTAPRTATEIAASLTVQERLFLFCIASRTNWGQAGVNPASAAALVVRNLVERVQSVARFRLTPLGRKVFAALVGLPGDEQHERGRRRAATG